MNRNQKRRLEREQLKAEKSITIDLAETLQDALNLADNVGVPFTGYQGKFYIKVNDNWHEQDIINDLLQFPKYKEIYDEYRVKPNVGDIMAQDLLMIVFQSNLGEGNELDLSHLLNN
jgi:hypothetical protein